jgi:hypothetical protein
MGIATTTASITQRQVSDQNSQGTILGASVTDLIGFYGVTTAVAQLAVNNLSASSGALASSIAFQLNKLGLLQCTTFAA